MANNSYLLPTTDDPIGRTVNYQQAENVFNSLEKAGIDPDGSAWLKTILDPFHDEALKTEGQPSYDQANTITQVIKVSRTFSAPSTILDGNKWDMHVTNLPIDVTTLENTATQVNNLLLATHSGAMYNGNSGIPATPDLLGNIGMITVARVRENERTFPNGVVHFPLPAQDIIQYDGLSPVAAVRESVDSQLSVGNSATYCDGPHRVIGLGFEVVNTTPPLNAGGLITVYRQNRVDYEQWTRRISPIVGPNTEIPPASDMVVCKAPPSNQDEAILLPDSRQWHAKDGAYVVCTQNGWNNGFQLPMSKRFCIRGDDPKGGWSTADQNLQNAIVLDTRSGIGTWPEDVLTMAPAPQSFHPWATSGCYLTGLSKESVITVNVRIIMERAPSISEPDLIVLATPSPAADELAWRFYSEARRVMPVGVRLNENSLGTWFKDVANIFKDDILPRALNVGEAFLPLAGPKGMLAADVINVARNKGGGGGGRNGGGRRQGGGRNGGRQRQDEGYPRGLDNNDRARRRQERRRERGRPVEVILRD